MFSAMLPVLLCALQPPFVLVEDNAALRHSATLDIRTERIVDADGNGVLHIEGNDLVIDMNGMRLHGAAEGAAPNTFNGIGIRITGRNITLRNGSISGFKVGIHAEGVDGLVLEDLDISDNFAHHLRSTPAAEDGGDWLWPHRNDNDEWVTNYGAGIFIKNAEEVTVRRITARRTQNGIIISNVNNSRFYDNDCSFLSGWGLAMWRSSNNIITRNAFDFCVRGYSHGVYNRGQDSAGILMFEQCNDNIIAENSATHGGDGFFGFGGLEALGDHWLKAEQRRLRTETGEENVDHLLEYPDELLAFVERRGNNRNLLIRNDFSYAPAHGIEMTFSFDNMFLANRLVGNAICGIWGGYSQRTIISGNLFADNGEMAYGLERGGVNIEHGTNNRIQFNTFRNNKSGVHLWWDNDVHLFITPWAKTNHRGSIDNRIEFNHFEGDQTAIHLRQSKQTRIVGNYFSEVGVDVDRDDDSDITRRDAQADEPLPVPDLPEYPVFGEATPIGARAHLAGREHIIMTEWGPYDWEQPLLQLVERTGEKHVYRLLGDERLAATACNLPVRVDRTGDDPRIIVEPEHHGSITPYELIVATDQGTRVRAAGVLTAIEWTIRVFAWQTDPREDVDQWHREAEDGITFNLNRLHLPYAMGGPSTIAHAPDHVRAARLPNDRFGTIARSTVHFPAGTWRIITDSDDGIRVWVNDELVIDDWTWHAPTRHTTTITFDAPTEAQIRVEHFELDGYALLNVEFEPADEE